MTSVYGNCQSGKMATEPNKTEILTIFKRLRSIPTNKVTDTTPSVSVYHYMMRCFRYCQFVGYFNPCGFNRLANCFYITYG